MIRRVLRTIAGVVLFLVILSAPAIFERELHVGGENEDHRIHVNLGAPLDEVKFLAERIRDGRLFEYQAGKIQYDIRHTLPRAAVLSLAYLGIPVLFSLLLGVPLGMSAALGRLNGGLNILALLGSIPDFILVLLLQASAVALAGLLGYRVARIGYHTGQSPWMLLPLIVMGLPSLAFVVRTAMGHTRNLLSEEFLLLCRAKGLPNRLVVVRHLLPGVLKGLEGDLRTMLLLVSGNLFIVEHLFGLPGLARFLFAYGFTLRTDYAGRFSDFGAQFNVVLLCLGVLASISILLALLVRGLFAAVVRTVDHG